MDGFLVRNLEKYMAGRLTEAERSEYESRMARRPKDRRDVEQMEGISDLFSALDLPDRDFVGPTPGFCARVLRRIDAGRQPVFWDFLLQPVVIRRVAMASCAWLLMLVSANAYDSTTQPSVEDIAQTILAMPPESADYCNVRLGCDIDMNRSSMLAAVMVSGNAAP